jgi:hypothetical protein
MTSRTLPSIHQEVDQIPRQFVECCVLETCGVTRRVISLLDLAHNLIHRSLICTTRSYQTHKANILSTPWRCVQQAMSQPRKTVTVPALTPQKSASAAVQPPLPRKRIQSVQTQQDSVVAHPARSTTVTRDHILAPRSTASATAKARASARASATASATTPPPLPTSSALAAPVGSSQLSQPQSDEHKVVVTMLEGLAHRNDMRSTLAVLNAVQGLSLMCVRRPEQTRAALADFDALNKLFGMLDLLLEDDDDQFDPSRLQLFLYIIWRLCCRSEPSSLDRMVTAYDDRAPPKIVHCLLKYEQYELCRVFACSHMVYPLDNDPVRDCSLRMQVITDVILPLLRPTCEERHVDHVSKFFNGLFAPESRVPDDVGLNMLPYVVHLLCQETTSPSNTALILETVQNMLTCAPIYLDRLLDQCPLPRLLTLLSQSDEHVVLNQVIKTIATLLSFEDTRLNALEVAFTVVVTHFEIRHRVFDHIPTLLCAFIRKFTHNLFEVLK